MALIKITISTSDPVTGKKLKGTLTGMSFDLNGQVKHITYLVSFSNANDTDPTITGTNQQKRSLTSYEDRYDINGKSILSTTRVYSPLFQPDGVTPIANAVTIASYLELKANNSLPGVGNGDPTWNVIQGIFKELVLIMQANGELPI